jgi:Tol biopolymer transport system component
MPGPGVYSSWHPSGNAIAFSVNRVVQVFPSTATWHIEVFDTASDLMVYDTRSKTVSTAPVVTTPDLENLPAWSPDGRYLYYCRAARPSGANFSIDDGTGGIVIEQPNGSWESDGADVHGGGQDNARVKDIKRRVYDLVRISYDIDTKAWGEPEVVLSSKETGKSISFPRLSPDGRYLMFTMSAFGYFTIHHADADLYVMDVASRRYRRLDEVNSDDVESFHSWSSNGRWFVFSSKRLDGIRARPFMAYFDQAGKARKPFLMPQKDPDFYRTFLMTYNVPELVTGKVRVSERALRNSALQAATPVAMAR